MIASRSHGWPAKVHRDERLRPRRDRPLRWRAGSMLKRIGLDVDEHRTRPSMDDDVRRRGKSDRRGDHFVAGADACRFERQVKRRRARVHGDAVRRARVGREVLLEPLRPRSGRQPPGSQRLEHRPLVVGVDQRLMVRKERGSNRGAALDCQGLSRLNCHGISFIVGRLRVSVKPMPELRPLRRPPTSRRNT